MPKGAQDKPQSTPALQRLQPRCDEHLGRTESDVAARGIALAAIIMFVGIGSAVIPDAIRAMLGDGPGPDRLLTTALLLNIAIVMLGWQRYRELTDEVAARRRAEEKAWLLAETDALTGLLNRRAIEMMLEREVQRLQRFGQSFSVLMVDIDHFKRINDRFGHAAGDAVLSAVADTLRSQAREVDRVSRYGGEEFCVLLPHTSHEGAALAAERLRDAINQIQIPWDDDIITVTVSTGMACATDRHEHLRSLLRRADEALYQAKAEGRNRVVICQKTTSLRAA